MPTKHFEIAGHAVHVFHRGPTTLPGVAPDLSRGRVLLFLHGAGSNGGIWNRQLDHYAERQSPLAFDYPGHGRSSGTEALGSVGAYGDVALALLDRLGVRSAVLVGASMGGAVAIDLALRAPERVAALVLLSTTARFRLAPEVVEKWRLVMVGRAPQPFTPDGYGDDVPFELMREGWEHQVKTDPRVRYFDLVACQQCDLEGRLADVRKPTLVVHGTKDSVVPPEAAAALERRIAGARRVEIAGGGHFLYRERPAELHAALDGFLDSLGEPIPDDGR